MRWKRQRLRINKCLSCVEKQFVFFRSAIVGRERERKKFALMLLSHHFKNQKRKKIKLSHTHTNWQRTSRILRRLPTKVYSFVCLFVYLFVLGAAFQTTNQPASQPNSQPSSIRSQFCIQLSWHLWKEFRRLQTKRTKRCWSRTVILARSVLNWTSEFKL